MEIILIIILTSVLTGISTSFGFILLMKKIQFISNPKKKPKTEPKPKIKASAKNSIAVNSITDQQKIRTAEIEIPVIAEDVLTYEGGELGAAYPEKTRLFYSKEAISDPEYLETVMRSPLQMGTHQKNTGEHNISMEGCLQKVWYDDIANRVMGKGFVLGEENCKYAEENKNLPGFGTSAFISFLKIDRTPGTAPNGKPYDAIVRKAVNNHVAILPGIRDQNNVIVAMNAVENAGLKWQDAGILDVATVKSTNKTGIITDVNGRKFTVKHNDGTKKTYDASELEFVLNSTEEKSLDVSEKKTDDTKNAINMEAKKMPMDKDEFKQMYNAIKNEEAEELKKADALKNAIKNELKEEEGKPAKTENAPEDKKEEKTENADEDKKDEAANAIPSEEMVKDFSTHLGVTFSKTPSLKGLGSLIGITAKNSAELITALNAKREEFKKGKVQTEVSNSNVTLADIMAGI